MKALKAIWSLLPADQRRSSAILLTLMLAGAALETLGVGLMIPLIALMTQPDIGAQYPQLRPLLARLGYPSQATLIIAAMVGLTAVYLVKGAFLLLLAWREARAVSGLQMHLSQRLFTTYLRQPYTFHLQRNSAELIHSATSEVAIVVQRAVIPAITVIAEGVTLTGIAALAVLVEPLGVLAVAIVLGAAGAAFHLATRTHASRWGRAQEYHEELKMHHLIQGLSSAKDVKLLGREDEFLAQFRSHNVQGALADERLNTLQRVPRLWLEILSVAGLATLVITLVSRGDTPAVILPTVGFVTAAAFRLMPSVSRILWSLQAVRSSATVVENVKTELSLEAPEPPATRAASSPLLRQLALTGVSYTYPGATSPALTRVTIRIDKGQSVGLIGPSGSGKSTLVDLILGLLEPSEGEVLMDGVDIRTRIRSWQDQIGYVPQFIYLTDESLRRNVAFGLRDDEIDDEAITKAIASAHLTSFVLSLDKGVDTIVGERGVRLSGGERQRVGIARALYHDPAVLVLDEATSALDSEAERAVMAAVTTLRGIKTLVIVSHRESTVEHCDKLYRLERGGVVEEGSPRTMIFRRPDASLPG